MVKVAEIPPFLIKITRQMRREAATGGASTATHKLYWACACEVLVAAGKRQARRQQVALPQRSGPYIVYNKFA